MGEFLRHWYSANHQSSKQERINNQEKIQIKIIKKLSFGELLNLITKTHFKFIYLACSIQDKVCCYCCCVFLFFFFLSTGHVPGAFTEPVSLLVCSEHLLCAKKVLLYVLGIQNWQKFKDSNFKSV